LKKKKLEKEFPFQKNALNAQDHATFAYTIHLVRILHIYKRHEMIKKGLLLDFGKINQEKNLNPKRKHETLQTI